MVSDTTQSESPVKATLRGAEKVLSWCMLAMIRLYWLTLSPIIGGVCRFQPTCSRYTAACIKLHGPIGGGWLGFKRICRCHPFCEGGFDSPPPSSHRGADQASSLDVANTKELSEEEGQTNTTQKRVHA